MIAYRSDPDVPLFQSGALATLGITVAAHHQRKGYAKKKALRNVIAYIFQTLKKHRVYASVDPENTASATPMSPPRDEKRGTLYRKSPDQGMLGGRCCFCRVGPRMEFIPRQQAERNEMKTTDFHGFPNATAPRFIMWAAVILGLLALTGCPALNSRRMPPTTPQNGNTLSAAPLPKLYGNIHGTITDLKSGAPVSGARIYLADTTVRRYHSEIQGAVPSDDGWIVIPPIRNAVRKGRSKMDGTFLINRVPTADPPKTYTIIIVTPKKDTLLVENATIYPGASQALHLGCRIPSKGKAHVASTDEASPYVAPTYTPAKP